VHVADALLLALFEQREEQLSLALEVVIDRAVGEPRLWAS
jgi:hypothetical protein